MKYIICGLEHVGLRVAETLLDLNEEIRVITLHKNESSLFYIRERLTKYVEGDARYPEILKLAGIDDADYLLIFTSNEIKNIEINCKAKEVNPNIKTALLINNLSYAKIIEQGFETDCVFHLPSIVSLPIVSACINKNILHTLHSDKSNYYFSFVNCEEHGFLLNKTIQEIESAYNIKVVNHFCPEKSHIDHINNDYIITGGSLVYITTNEVHFNQDDFILQQKNASELVFSESSNRFEFFKRFTITPGIRKVLLMYAILILVSVIIFKSFIHLSVIDALYFVITTTSTVGYGDFNLQSSPVWIKIFGSFIMLAGAALLATLFSVITDNIISRRLGGYVGIYNRKMKDHIIVAGLGSIGLGVVNFLVKIGIKTVVIERNPENHNIPLLQNKVPVLIGDASEQKILIKAGIKKAKTLAALIDNDLNNINIILKGNLLKEDLHAVARIFSNELNSKAKTTFQIDNVISASNIAVPYIISDLVYKDTIWAGYIHDKIYTLISLQLKENSFLLENKKNQIIDKYGMCPLLVKRNNKIIYIGDDSVFEINDLVYLFGQYQSLKNIGGC